MFIRGRFIHSYLKNETHVVALDRCFESIVAIQNSSHFYKSQTVERALQSCYL